jgi:hypothetical protein
MRPHGRAQISRSKPRAQAVCDRCGMRYSHHQLRWQFDWVGARLQNLRILVCAGCYDKPQENIRTIILPPDPMPIHNPRPEWFPQDNSPISGIGWEPANLFSLKRQTSNAATFSGALTGGGGPDSCFFGDQKTFVQSASRVPSINSALGNNVTINWNNIPGQPTTPAQLSTPVQSYSIFQAIVKAPIDAAFLGSNIATVLTLAGSNDGVSFTTLGSSNTLGTRGEVVTILATLQSFFSYHLISVTGDGIHAAAISVIELFTPGPSLAQTGSELGA